MVNQLKQLFPRSTGSQWNIPKLHEQLHVAYNIHLWGSHKNIHTGPQEYSHIENMKKSSDCTQKRKVMFDFQIAHLLVDKYIIDYTQNKIAFHQQCNNLESEPVPLESNKITQSTLMATKFEVIIKRNEIHGNIIVQSQWRTGSQKGQTVSASILDNIIQLYFNILSHAEQQEGIHLYGLTEYCREKVTFRAHPNYRNEGPWYDYVLIAWNEQNEEDQVSDNDSMQETLDMSIQTDDDDKIGSVLLIPAKVICFVMDDDKEITAIIHSCLQKSKKASVLTYQWQLEYEENQKGYDKLSPYNEDGNTSNCTPIYHKVSVDTFQKNILMIPYHTSSKFLLEIMDQSKWAQAFM